MTIPASAEHRLFSVADAFHNPVTVWITALVATLLIATPVAIAVATRGGRGGPALRDDLNKRYKSWLILAPLMILPVLAGAAATIIAAGVLGILAHREFARATGLFRDRLTSALVVVAIALLTFAAFDNWRALFMAIAPLGTAAIVGLNIFYDRPKGYVQRVAQFDTGGLFRRSKIISLLMATRGRS